MFKHNLAACGAISVAAAALLVGCGGSGSGGGSTAAGGKTTVNWSMWASGTADANAWKAVASAVTQKHPDITVKLQTLPFNDYFTKLAAQASGGNAPCLLGMQSLRAPGLGQLLRPLDDLAKKQGVAPDKISGTIQNDILKEYIARGTYIYPPRQSLRIVTDIFAYCARDVPRWNTSDDRTARKASAVRDIGLA